MNPFYGQMLVVGQQEGHPTCNSSCETLSVKSRRRVKQEDGKPTLCHIGLGPTCWTWRIGAIGR